LDGETLEKYKQKLVKLSDYEMSEIAIRFVTNIMDDFEGAREQATNFNALYEPPKWCDASTRVANQLMVIALVENLFCHYMCSGNQELSGHDELVKALEKNGRSQTKLLQQKQRNDQVRPGLSILYEMIQAGENCNEIKISREKSEYMNGMDATAYREKTLEHDFFFITRASLQIAFTKYLGKPISLKKLSDEFHDSGILVEDVDKRTKKFLERRHYVINVNALAVIIKTLEGDAADN
jgi:hypothetical protein